MGVWVKRREETGYYHQLSTSPRVSGPSCYLYTGEKSAPDRLSTLSNTHNTCIHLWGGLAIRIQTLWGEPGQHTSQSGTRRILWVPP